MTDLAAAKDEYLCREAAANSDMRGADHQKIMADVAKEYGVDQAILTDVVLDHSFLGPN